MKRLFKITWFLAKTVIVIWIAVWLFMLQPSFGSKPSGERLERIKKSSHFREGRFQNRIETPMYPEDESMLTVMYHFLTTKTAHREPDDSIPAVKRNLKANPSSPVAVVTWFGHSTTLLQIEGKNILTDPIFSHRASPVEWAGPKAFAGTALYSPDDLPKIDAVLISHDHYDHLDYKTIVALKDKADYFFVPFGVGAHLERWGIPLNKIIEADWWTETLLPGGLTIVSTPSRHFSGRGFTQGLTSWGSYAIIKGNQRVYFSGDSGYDTHFKEVGEKYGPFDLAMIETGQYNRLWPNIHMMPENSVQAASDLRAKLMLNVHWSKFALALHPWDEPIKRALVKAKELDIKIATPMIGEETKIDSGYVKTKWFDALANKAE